MSRLAPGPTRGRGRILTGLIGVTVLVALGAVAWWWFTTEEAPGPDAAAEAVGAALTTGDLTAAPFGPRTDEAASRHAEILDALDGLERSVERAALEHDEEGDPDRATARYAVTWTLPGDREWSYEVAAELHRVDPDDREGDGQVAGTTEGWQAAWTDTLAHPEVPAGGRLDLRRTTPERADVVATDGTPLVTDREVVDVGIQPSRVDDLDETVAEVRELLDLQLDDLPDRIEAADPDLFVAVVTLRAEDFDEVEDELVPVPGTVFRRTTQPLAPTADFARATLGRAGPVTAEMIEEHPDRYEAGDVAGLSGLQAVHDEQLAGRPGLEVLALPPEGEGSDDEGSDDEGPGDVPDPRVLFRADPEPGEPVTVTLDEAVQRAADAALADTTDLPSALVAVRISDGHVLAVANGPGNGGADLALTGRYPPGSTFKIVTTAALLDAGLGPDDTVSCPAEATVDGRAFTNAEDAELGEVPLRTAFAESCNTAFVSETAELDDDVLRDTAAAFGLGVDPQLGLPAFGGQVPVTEPGTDRVAAGIGQGRVLASPFALADLIASATRGAALPPSLVLDEPEDAPEAVELPSSVAQVLPELLREVVTDGSGGAVADVPGGPVSGKTGTAEYGDEVPPRTHAWFVGAQDDLAFAVLVAETEDALGGSTAAPLAADFLTTLADAAGDG